MRSVFVFILVTGFFLSFISVAIASPPSTITYQGTLGTSSGQPVTATLNIEFKLYDVAQNGTPLWTETLAIDIEDGKFAVELGTLTPLVDELFGQPLYLGIQVEGDVEMTPRPQLTATAFSFRARSLLRNTIHVPVDGTAQENGDALAAAVATAVSAATMDNPFVVELDAGDYALGATLEVGPFVSLAGRGSQATLLRAALTGPAVLLNSDSGIRDLSISNSGDGGNFASPVTAVSIAPDTDNVQIERARLHTAPPIGNQGVDVRVALNSARVSNLRVRDVEAIAERSDSLYGIRASFVEGMDPFETGISFERVRVLVRAGSNFMRGLDSNGRQEIRINDFEVVMEDGGISAQNAIGIRTQLEVSADLSNVRIDLRLANSQPEIVVAQVLFESRRLALTNFQYLVNAGSCASGIRSGISLNDGIVNPTILEGSQPTISNGSVSVLGTECFVAGIEAAGSRPILENVTVRAEQLGTSNGAGGFIQRTSNYDCGTAPSAPGVASIRHSQITAIGPSSSFPAAADACVSEIEVVHSSLEGTAHAIRAQINDADSLTNVRVGNSHLRSVDNIPLILLGNTVQARIVNSELEHGAVSPVAAYLQGGSPDRAVAICLGISTIDSFAPGPLCPCTAGIDCPNTP
ncbi:MAG: hypothetical protein KDI71_16500 [Xanthomonadales bacterium]|nr:hypothetical protein [Xanthomonadales bacterium]